MAGFPGEREIDIDGIWETSVRISDERRQVAGAPASVNAGVSWLVPKPYTPFQWAAQPTADYFHWVRRRLREVGRQYRAPVRVKTHDVERSVLEAVFARGDRKLSRRSSTPGVWARASTAGTSATKGAPNMRQRRAP